MTEKNSKDDCESDDETEIQLQYKVVILGDGAVGKTSICKKFVENHFANSYKQTVGLDFFVKRMILTSPKNEKYKIALQIWDIGGQSVGSKMLKRYIHGSNFILFAYDITNHTTFDNMEDWLGIVQETFKDSPNKMPMGGIVGNKWDLTHMQSVKPIKHKKFVDQHKFKSYYVSAKTGDGLSAMFYHIASELSGIKMSKTDLEAHTKVVTAGIINHEQNDPTEKKFNQILKDSDKKDCILL